MTTQTLQNDDVPAGAAAPPAEADQRPDQQSDKQPDQRPDQQPDQRSDRQLRRAHRRRVLRKLRTAVIVLVMLAAAATGGTYLVRQRLAARAFVSISGAVLTADPVPV